MKTNRMMILNLFMVTLSLVLSAYSMWYFISTINVGPELSDSAYYTLMRTQYADIGSMFSGFGVLVAAFAGTADMQTIRFYNMLVMVILPALFLVAVCRDVLRDALRNESRYMLVSGILVSSCASLAYYRLVLLDVSYNSLVFVLTYLCALSLWALWGEVQRKKSTRVWVLSIWAFVLGAGVFYLSYIKISSGALFTLVFLPISGLTILVSEGYLNRKGLACLNLRAFGVFALIMLGAATAFAFVSARTLPPNELYARFITGLTGVVLLKGHTTKIAGHFLILIKTLLELLELLWAIAIPLLCLAVIQLAGWCRIPRLLNRILLLSNRRHTLFVLMSGVVLLWAVILVAVHLIYLHNFVQLAQITWFFAIALSFLSMFEMRKSPRRVLFVILFAWAPYLMSFGTNNHLITHLTIFSGAAVTAIFLAAITLERLRPLLMPCAVILGAGIILGAIDYASRFPYRMSAPLSEATQYFDVQGEHWRVTPPLAESYRAMEEIRATKEWRDARKDDRPVMLDMSGLAPALNWLGDFRIPWNAWTFCGFKGSDAVLSWALDHVKTRDLHKMWIAVDEPSAKGERVGLSIDILNARLKSIGLMFPKDYVQIGNEIPLAYAKRTARLYAPRALSEENR